MVSPVLPPPNPIRYDGVPQRYLRQFHVALANAANAPCDIMVVGDSIGEGALNSVATDRWIERLQTKLRARFQPAGVTGGVGYVPARVNINGITSRFVNNGGSLTSLVGLGQRAVILNSSGDTLALVATATTFRLFYYQDPALGSFTWQIDGGGATTINCNGTNTIGKTVDIATGSAGSHTLLLTWVSGTVYIEGAMVLNGDESAGLRMWDASSGGAISSSFEDTAYLAYAQNWLFDMSRVNPDLVLVALGGNDASYQYSADPRGRTPAQLATNLKHIATLIRANAAPDPSIAFVIGYDWPNFAAGWWATYRPAIYGAAIEDGNVGVIDLYQRFGAKGDLSALGLVPDGTHLTALGSEFYANAISGYLEP